MLRQTQDCESQTSQSPAFHVDYLTTGDPPSNLSKIFYIVLVDFPQKTFYFQFLTVDNCKELESKFLSICYKWESQIDSGNCQLKV